MPELPEVETITRSLNKHILNKTISDVTVLSEKQFPQSTKSVIGFTIRNIERFGKTMTMTLEKNAEIQYLTTHLKMSGQLLYSTAKQNGTFEFIIPPTNSHHLPNAMTRVILIFSDGSKLFFNDLRKFGWMKVTKEKEIKKSIDVLSLHFTVGYFSEVISKKHSPIKAVLLDQTHFTGIGNIYANEVLFLAKIRPTTIAAEISKALAIELHKQIVEIMKKAIIHHGSSSSDEMFIMPNGEKGNFQNYILAYHREKKPCVNCGTQIIRIKQNGRSSFYCPQCQI